MEVIIIEKESYYRLMEETFALMYKVVKEKFEQDEKNGKKPEEERLNAKEALALLKSKNRNLLYELRKKNLISYYQIRGNVTYCKQSLINFIRAHKVQ